MTENRKRILWITRTAIFLALLIVVQAATAPFKITLLTGSLVNIILAVSVITGGLSSGLIVAVVSPVLATLVGIGPPFWVIVPFIMLGNAVFVLLWHVIARRTLSEKRAGSAVAITAAAIVAGAAGKFLVLYVTVVRLAVPLLLAGIPAKQAAVISASFSVSQLFTALIGGAVAAAAIPIIRKGMAGRTET